MKSLITGGSGFIGSHLAEELLKRGDTVEIIDNLSTGSLNNISHLLDNKNFSYTIDTILNKKVMEKLVARSDRIFHLAAAVGVKLIMDRPIESIETNVRGTEEVLKLANRYKKKVLITSTSEIYGNHVEHSLKEDDNRVMGSVRKRRWSYACSKTVDEFLALAYHLEKKLPIVIVRIFNTVGPRQTGAYGMVIPNFVESALLGKPLGVYGDGKQSRCFAYVGDVVNALIGLMESPEAEGEVFNIGSEQEISIEDLAKKVINATDSSSEIEYVSYERAYGSGFEDMRKRTPNISKIRNLIGYEPSVDIDGILDRVIDYFKS